MNVPGKDSLGSGRRISAANMPSGIGNVESVDNDVRRVGDAGSGGRAYTASLEVSSRRV
jgi:hypothetical protein